MEPTDESDDVEPNDPESVLLIAIWRHLDAAEQLSVAPEAMSNLSEIAGHCKAVVARIRTWRDDEAAGRT